MQKKRKIWLWTLFCAAATLLPAQGWAQYTVSGHVVDENDEPLIGVAIHAKNGKEAAVTRLDGPLASGVKASANLLYCFISLRSSGSSLRSRLMSSRLL